MDTNVKKRILWLDVARTVAIISVTFNHALSRSFETHEGTLEEFNNISKVISAIKAVLYVFSRLGVPLFMIKE